MLDDRPLLYFESLPEKFKLNKDHYRILEHRGRDRNAITKEMTSGGKLDDFDQEAFLKSELSENIGMQSIWNTFLEKDGNKGYIKTGVVQFGVGISFSPVNIIRQTNTNKAGVQEGKMQVWLRWLSGVVEHGVYCMPFFVNPNYARKSGCTADEYRVAQTPDSTGI